MRRLDKHEAQDRLGFVGLTEPVRGRSIGVPRIFKHHQEGWSMRLRLLGTTSKTGGCPALYETDRGTYVVQGQAVTDPEALADLRDVLPGEIFVEIPKAVLGFAPPEDR
ncbi:hypothetical protein [Acrocarpospora sp. B8E8]|uniref:hypothetical protein n=1 Tax=Acrocarpospora sp. B8E8 TaxID=3153572 RepID=UPI00325D9644